MNAVMLKDIVIGETVLQGRTTTGSLVTGIVKRIVPGVGFEVGGGAFLWREFALGKEAPTNLSLTESQGPLPVPGIQGYPDCDFWVEQGVEPLFVATASNFFDWALPIPIAELRTLLNECRDVAEGLGGTYLAAWKRQCATTEPSTIKIEGCEWLTVDDSVVVTDSESHCTKPAGIPAGEFTASESRYTIPSGSFIKPDPALTQLETRHYLMGELARYLKGLLTPPAAVPASAPASRMAHLYRLLKAAGKLPSGKRTIEHVAHWVFTVIQTSVTVGRPKEPTEYETLALAFWEVDLLPCGKTIGSFWNYSPFEALRTAPPLTDVEDAVPLPASPSDEKEEDYSDMAGLISLEALAAQEEDYSDMPPLIPISSADEDEEGDYVAYNTMPRSRQSGSDGPKSLEDTVGGAVESLMRFALRPVTIPVWGIALALAILPPLFMNKC